MSNFDARTLELMDCENISTIFRRLGLTHTAHSDNPALFFSFFHAWIKSMCLVWTSLSTLFGFWQGERASRRRRLKRAETPISCDPAFSENIPNSNVPRFSAETFRLTSPTWTPSSLHIGNVLHCQLCEYFVVNGAGKLKSTSVLFAHWYRADLGLFWIPVNLPVFHI